MATVRQVGGAVIAVFKGGAFRPIKNQLLMEHGGLFQIVTEHGVWSVPSSIRECWACSHYILKILRGDVPQEKARRFYIVEV